MLESEKAAKAVEKEDAACGESPSLRLSNEPSRAAAEDSDGDWQEEEESFDEEQAEYDADAIRRSLRLSDESAASLAAAENSDGVSMPRLSPEVSDDDGPPPRRPGKLAPPRAAPEGSDDDDGPPPLQLDSDSDDSVVITYKA